MIDDISTLVKELELDGSTISSKEDLYALIDREKENKQLRLRYELQNPHSMFYYKVANNFANTNLETFHKNIKDAASKTGLKNNYMAVAYHLGLYVFNLPQENEILDDKEELKATGPKRILTKPE